MRSRILLRRTGLCTKTSSVATRALLSYSGPARYPRNDLRHNVAKGTRVTRRASTSSTRPQAVDSAPSPSSSDTPAKEPDGSNGKSESSVPSQALEPSTLPPPEVFEEILNNVYLALHPQVQHKATYSTPSGPPTEPTLALYCPIEGGNYVIDDTVRELARRTGSDVVVLDAVHIAAGEWGHFGQAASLIELPQNPLHFPSQNSSTTRHDDYEEDSTYYPPSQMTFQLVLPPQIPLMSGGASSKKNVVKTKAFFEMCINLQAPADAGSSNGTQRPRLVYIRDFSTLSSSWSSLHPVLLSAVRQRRQGVLSRPTSPVTNPTTIIFGITPPIFPSTSSPSSPPPGPHDMVNVLTSNGQAGPGVATPKLERSDWSEEDHAEKARERRLRERLRKWERGDSALQSEIPKLVTAIPVEEESGSNPANFMFLGSPGGANPLVSLLSPLLGGRRPSPQSEIPNSNSSTNSGFLRTSVLVPASRSLLREKTSRVGRRREINELTMRMAIGAIGGLLEARSAASVFTPSSELAQPPAEPVAPENMSNAAKMWEDWGNRITAWAQAVGRVVSSSLHSQEMVKPSLSAASVLWDHVCGAWAGRWASHGLRKAWMQRSAGRSAGGQHGKAWDDETDTQVDDIVESVRHEPSLDMHEHRLLGCIVDSASMPTSFAHVHLPAHTIDSVRTIVSLPMLHPTAFQQGILKEHSMRGCLLFGPPGTGKTLVVRALAKEAGCRMLVISPSDVMDMYVGEGEKLVRSVFSLARRLAPCVVFIDEIDALFGARSSSSNSGGGSAHRGVITEFMQEMDGLKTSNADNVIVIGATNRPFDLDDAVLRRLPRRLLVDLPGEGEREEILKILLRDETLSPDVDLKALARDTPTFSGSDLKHACVSAALDAVKENVSVPWVVDRNKNDHQDTLQTNNTERKENAHPASGDSESATQRVLRPHNFAKALKEITPSASESLGSLADLRKWNDEFGEGRKRRKQVWGKDRFGFTKQWHSREDGRVTTCRHLRRLRRISHRHIYIFIPVFALRQTSSCTAWPFIFGCGRLANGNYFVVPGSTPVLAALGAFANGSTIRIVTGVVHPHSTFSLGTHVTTRKDLSSSALSLLSGETIAEPNLEADDAF
ncbi:hypothetical protein H4582DRAFT_2116806 [Lactarius indigo]|nr:hypothetical protein H4582DRAFT_2116806 [Lactarius indigo]